MEQEQSHSMSMNERQKKETIGNAVAGGIIIAVILLVTTIWVSNGARNGTSQAVSRVLSGGTGGKESPGSCRGTENKFLLYGKCHCNHG